MATACKQNGGDWTATLALEGGWGPTGEGDCTNSPIAACNGTYTATVDANERITSFTVNAGCEI